MVNSIPNSARISLWIFPLGYPTAIVFEQLIISYAVPKAARSKL